jgi:molybdopterin molybdotransferase
MTEPSARADVRMRGFPSRVDVDEVWRLVRELAQPLTSEPVGLEDAAGRVLASQVVAPIAVPGFARAAMDGYSVRGEETFGASDYNPLTFRLIGEAMPGRPFPGVVESGQAVRIMTGAPLPRRADAVIMAEYARESEGPSGKEVAVTESVPPGRHVGQVGEDIEAGQALLCPGRVLRPQDVGVLASVGIGTVPVIRRPVVRLVITGDELLPPGSIPAGAQIVDSNSVMLEALVRRDGGIPIRDAIVPDRLGAVEAAILDPRGDLVLVSGGSSVGAEDHAPLIVAQHGELLVHGVAMRPSSPTGLGRLGDRLVFLLPGNPVSCLCAYDFFAGPAIRLLGGRSPDWPHRQVRAPLTRKIASAVGRVDYVRVRLTDAGVEPLAISGASILSSTIRADGFVIVGRDSEGHAPGEEVLVYLYD